MLTGQGFGGLMGERNPAPASRVGQFNYDATSSMPGPAQSTGPMSGMPASTTVPAPAGPPPNSPLGMWQNWLKTMGPYLAQMPSSMPNQESGGLSSLAPSSTGTSLKGYSGQDTPWTGQRGFRMLYGLQ